MNVVGYLCAMRIYRHVLRAHARLKAEITMIVYTLARGPVCKKKRGKRIEEPKC